MKMREFQVSTNRDLASIEKVIEELRGKYPNCAFNVGFAHEFDWDHGASKQVRLESRYAIQVHLPIEDGNRFHLEEFKEPTIRAVHAKAIRYLQSLSEAERAVRWSDKALKQFEAENVATVKPKPAKKRAARLKRSPLTGR